MKRTVLLLILMVVLAGCIDQQAKRQSFEDRFQAAYPDDWQQRLLEYDIEEKRLAEERRAKWHRAYTVSQGENVEVEVDSE